ncbi:alpha/beta hydrolase, partial [Nocardia sp. NPDC049707]|uniref:alpha/beta fold hydrolase n=1 Tax=Nocardia sp. NPDC049707 TaxID=3154735 RepID=UPI0034194BF3
GPSPRFFFIGKRSLPLVCSARTRDSGGPRTRRAAGAAKQTRLADIAAPTLVLRGGPGGMVDPEKLAMLRDTIPDCAVAAFTCGHSIHRDRYREFEATVLPFLATHAPTAGQRI